MIRNSTLWYLLFLNVALLTCCSRPAATSGKAADEKSVQITVPSPPCMIYKTRSDYSKNVPVILSDDKSKIVSFPDIKDVYHKEKLAYPTSLAEGYLLDNRGIGPDAAFLKMTYEEYAQLDKTPDVKTLYENILDKDPFLVMYQCGKRSDYKDIENELNEMITHGRLSSCKKLK